MVSIDDLLCKNSLVSLEHYFVNGSLFVRLDDNDVLVGTALLKDKDGNIIPCAIDSAKFGFIRNFKIIMDKLKNHNVIYCDVNGIFIGYREYRGPYAEEEVFVSFADAKGFSFVDRVIALDNKLSKNRFRRLELVKDGIRYRNK